MYNRYISQPDGSFEKTQVTEKKDTPPKQISPHQTAPQSVEILKQIMPFNMDSSDMLVFIMLLLINGGSGNEYNALMTLVFYLFL